MRWTSFPLLLLLVAIVIMVVHNDDVKAAAAKRALAAVKPSITATVATAAKGNIGIYLDAIGTVTPVYTTAVMPQASPHFSQGASTNL
jgi:multidrug efflux system membrane fusion protein